MKTRKKKTAKKDMTILYLEKRIFHLEAIVHDSEGFIENTDVRRKPHLSEAKEDILFKMYLYKLAYHDV
ncbi:hypothetical protein EBZ38_07630 [bacterium]|jgi:hypothetical protein|nr:hypothetical protein [bacterium]